jgi:hypothetical protein
MTNPQSPQNVAAALSADLTDAQEAENTGPTVGAGDAEADAARSGADADLTGTARDSDGAEVGQDDLEADKRNSGA